MTHGFNSYTFLGIYHRLTSDHKIKYSLQVLTLIQITLEKEKFTTRTCTVVVIKRAKRSTEQQKLTNWSSAFRLEYYAHNPLVIYSFA